MHLFSKCNLVDIIWEYGKFNIIIFFLKLKYHINLTKDKLLNIQEYSMCKLGDIIWEYGSVP